MTPFCWGMISYNNFEGIHPPTCLWIFTETFQSKVSFYHQIVTNFEKEFNTFFDVGHVVCTNVCHLLEIACVHGKNSKKMLEEGMNGFFHIIYAHPRLRLNQNVRAIGAFDGRAVALGRKLTTKNNFMQNPAISRCIMVAHHRTSTSTCVHQIDPACPIVVSV